MKVGLVDQENSISIDALLPVACVGFMFHWGAVFIGIYFSDPLISSTDSSFELSRVSCLLGIALGLFVISVCSDCFKKASGRIRLAVLGFLLLSIYNVSTLLSFFGFVPPTLLTAVLWFGFGVGTSCGLMTWLDIFSYGKEKVTINYIIAGVFLGGLACLGSFSLSSVATLTLLILFPLFSLLILLFLFSRVYFPEHVSKKESEERYSLPLVSTITVGTYGVVFGVSQYMIFSDRTTFISPAVIGASVAVGCLILLLVNIATKCSVSYDTTQRVILPIMVVALLLIPFSDGIVAILCWSTLMAALTCYDTANMAILTKITHEQCLASFLFIAHNRMPIQIGMFGGWLLGFFLLNYRIADTDMMTRIALGMVMVLVIVTTAIPYDKSRIGSKPIDPVEVESVEARGSWQRRCEEVGESYGLSTRQQDVLVYLAKGRNAEYIQKELMVSSHTAKSHIYNIYRKLGIHSQQELIDLIEETKDTH